MTYRMVISPAEGKPPIAAFWFEQRRESVWWAKGPLGTWWTRWRRISRKEAMFAKDGDLSGKVMAFADEREMRLLQRYLLEIG